MKQYGGSIPFSVMKRVSKPKKTKRRSNKKVSKRTKKLGLSSKRYYPGTIIRKSGNLMKLTKDKKWIKL